MTHGDRDSGIGWFKPQYKYCCSNEATAREEQEKPKNLLHKLKEGMDDREEQMAILGAFVRLGVVIWSGFIITLNYVELPMIKKGASGDITFPASIFTGALATFGLEGSKKRSEKDSKVAENEGMVQTIRVITPIKIEGAEVIEPKPKK